jgi:hypothetical protein
MSGTPESLTKQIRVKVVFLRTQNLHMKTCPMKNPFDILRMKEQELLEVKREAEALRTTARLLDDDAPPAKKPQR